MAGDQVQKRYYCKVRAEFGRVLDSGEQVLKNPVESTWLDLDYGEAITFEALVLRPMMAELADDAIELGIQKAEKEGSLDKAVAAQLRNVLKKAPA